MASPSNPIRPPGLPAISGLYLITSDDGTAERSHVAVTAAALEGGARVVQLREKHLPDADFAEIAREVQRLCAEAGATFVVNDRAAVAMRLRADALHVGQGDLAQLDEWRPTWPAVFGVSCNGVEQIPGALALGAGYVGCGPVYPTSYEHSHKRVIGLDGLAEALNVSSVPLAAIGGVHEERIAEVAALGPAAICVKSAIAEAADMVAATRRLVAAIERVPQAGDIADAATVDATITTTVDATTPAAKRGTTTDEGSAA